MKKKPAYIQLYEEIRDNIIAGNYAYGHKLPSKRSLAYQNDVSEITAAHALALLEDEGYVETRQRSGTYVTYREGDFFESKASDTDVFLKQAGKAGTFPASVFAKACRRVLSDYGDGILAESEGRGDLTLRKAIAAYLGRNRDMHVSADQIIIGAGSEYLYSLLTSLLGRSVIYGVEDPSFKKIDEIYRSAGVRTDHLKLGKHGILTSELQRTPASVLHVTPYHSWPTGTTTNGAKRREYIHWACDRNAWIIEDDYASEFSVSNKPAETLYSLDNNHVIYMNTFTKTISPSIRCGYMILPERLCDVYQKKESWRSCTVSLYVQLVIADLLMDGDFERHLNRVRKQLRNDSVNEKL